VIRLILIFFLFISFGNFSSTVNNLILLSLINIAFFSLLKDKNLDFKDYLIFILSTFVIEILINVPLFISSVVLIIPIILFGFVINNLSMHKIFNSLIIYIMSIITLILLNTQILDNFILSEYLPSLLILIFTYFGYVNYGKK
jgi:hypothetical protein